MAESDKINNTPENVEVENTQPPDVEKAVNVKATTDADVVEPSPVKVVGVDKAAQFLKEADHQVVVTRAENRRVLKLIDWRILPLLL
jgi:hypothetical protein